MDDINLTCEIHNCPIGGVCSDLFCEGRPLMCIKCAIDENFCIRKLNHELITFEEFFKIYTKKIDQKMFINKKLTPTEFLKFLADFKFQEINSKFKDKVDFVNGFTNSKLNNYKKDIYDNAIDKVILNRQKYLQNDLKEVDDIINLTNEFKELSFLPDNKKEYKSFYKKFDDISKRVQDAEMLNKKNLFKLLEGKSKNFYFENEIDEIEVNEDTIKGKYDQSDYTNMNQLIALLKFLENESQNKKHIKTIEKSLELLAFYNNKIEQEIDFKEERERYNQLLIILEASIKKLIKTKKIDIEFNKKLEKGDDKQNDKLSLCKNLSLFCEIQYIDKVILSNTSNSLVEIFTARNSQRYMVIFSRNSTYSLMSLLPKNNDSKFAKMACGAPNLSKKKLLKVRHIQSKESDIIITHDTNKQLTLYKVDFSNISQPELIHLDGINIKANDYWTVEKVEDTYYLISSTSKEFNIYTISNDKLIPFYQGEARNQLSGFRMFKNKFTQKLSYLIIYSFGYYVQEIENKSNSKFCTNLDVNNPIIQDVPGQREYPLISSNGKTITINDLMTGTVIKKISIDEEIKSLELISNFSNDLLCCQTNKKVIYIDLEKGEEISNYLISNDKIVKILKESMGYLKITNLGNIKIYY